MEQLAHRVPASAAREYRASQKALENGNLEESIAHCRRALETDPDNASAHNDLGVLYLNNGQTEKARAEFREAAVLQPRMAMAHINESFALLALDRPGDAESSARKALEIVPADRRANLLLGWSLRAQFSYSKEALSSLQLAAREYPEAHLAAADVLIHDGSLAGARKEIEAYLASGSADQKSLAEAWLRLLTIE
jgi:Flp pilus assembly protein TadD